MNLATKLEHFNILQSDVDQMSKSVSPRGCIWHVDQVGQTPGQVGPGAHRPAGQGLSRLGPGLGCHVSTSVHNEESKA
jgi:hypothetical protein